MQTYFQSFSEYYTDTQQRKIGIRLSVARSFESGSNVTLVTIVERNHEQLEIKKDRICSIFEWKCGSVLKGYA